MAELCKNLLEAEFETLRVVRCVPWCEQLKPNAIRWTSQCASRFAGTSKWGPKLAHSCRGSAVARCTSSCQKRRPKAQRLGKLPGDVRFTLLLVAAKSVRLQDDLLVCAPDDWIIRTQKATRFAGAPHFEERSGQNEAHRLSAPTLSRFSERLLVTGVSATGYSWRPGRNISRQLTVRNNDSSFQTAELHWHYSTMLRA